MRVWPVNAGMAGLLGCRVAPVDLFHIVNASSYTYSNAHQYTRVQQRPLLPARQRRCLPLSQPLPRLLTCVPHVLQWSASTGGLARPLPPFCYNNVHREPTFTSSRRMYIDRHRHHQAERDARSPSFRRVDALVLSTPAGRCFCSVYYRPNIGTDRYSFRSRIRSHRRCNANACYPVFHYIITNADTCTNANTFTNADTFTNSTRSQDDTGGYANARTNGNAPHDGWNRGLARACDGPRASLFTIRR